SRVMAAVRSRQNKTTELRLISIFRNNGISGWRRNYKLMSKPDFVFLSERLAVSVGGCFWHGCSGIVACLKRGPIFGNLRSDLIGHGMWKWAGYKGGSDG